MVSDKSWNMFKYSMFFLPGWPPVWHGFLECNYIIFQKHQSKTESKKTSPVVGQQGIGPTLARRV